jgi:replicative DNA helicase
MDDWVADLEKRLTFRRTARHEHRHPITDRLLAPKGLVKGSLFVIGARPKMGKTTLYGQMAINCAVRESQALMFSLEMPGDQILEKLVGQKSGINPSIFTCQPRMTPMTSTRATTTATLKRSTAGRLSEIDMLYIDDTRPVTGAHR